MVQKRPFDDEELYDASSKHPRQVELRKKLVSILEFVPSEDGTQQTSNIGQDLFKKYKIEGEQKFTHDCIHELPKSLDKEIKFSAPGFTPGLSWITKEHMRYDAPFHDVYSPEDYDRGCPIRSTPPHLAEIYSLLLEYPHQKSVPVGPDHQAIIPEWCPPDKKSSDPIISKDDEKKLIGSCVIPMPEAGPHDAYSEKVGIGKIYCNCPDVGSVRCVRQHITEAKEKLNETLGQERLVELGFGYMGEQVSEDWSKEDENLFHEVVFSNPSSLGKNFWENLSMVFPSRTMKDIVRYYFNVFMLQRRAEQNRSDFMDIDSDNDEWQGSDDDASDDDSDEHFDSQIEKFDLHSNDENTHNATVDNNPNINFERAFETTPVKLYHDCSPDPVFQLNKPSWNEWVNHDFQDYSSTTSNSGTGSQETQKEADSSDSWPGSFGGLSNSHEYVLEDGHAKTWDDDRYMDCLGNKFDFSPTCSVIEEVFGNGYWNHKGKDGKH